MNLKIYELETTAAKYWFRKKIQKTENFLTEKISSFNIWSIYKFNIIILLFIAFFNFYSATQLNILFFFFKISFKKFTSKTMKFQYNSELKINK